MSSKKSSLSLSLRALKTKKSSLESNVNNPIYTNMYITLSYCDHKNLLLSQKHGFCMFFVRVRA